MIKILCDRCGEAIKEITEGNCSPVRIGAELPLTSWCDDCAVAAEKIEALARKRHEEINAWKTEQVETYRKSAKGEWR
ncbi:hypothetical protein LCGC14_1121440 [marine sediment metagenome]|uniref:Uncharacterized protein n=1 Tax=marine sediment metagenome TaxID=412755 RepID=A0A0F9M3U4_9ZZZZ